MKIENYSVNLEKGDRIVFKIGTSSIGDPSNKEHGLNERVIDSLGAGIYALHKKGIESIIVSSGALAAGEHNFGCRADKEDTVLRQTLCGGGDYIVSYVFNRVFSRYNMGIIQGLVTHKDLKETEERETLRNVFYEANVLPKKIGILKYNENDMISGEEVKAKCKDGNYSIGDNDSLMRIIGFLHKVNMAICVSDVDGLLDGDPSDPDSRLISIVEGETQFSVGKNTKRIMRGDITSKYRSLKELAQEGIAGIIVNCKYLDGDGSVQRILEGDVDRTLFVPKPKTVIKLG